MRVIDVGGEARDSVFVRLFMDSLWSSKPNTEEVLPSQTLSSFYDAITSLVRFTPCKRPTWNRVMYGTSTGSSSGRLAHGFGSRVTRVY